MQSEKTNRHIISKQSRLNIISLILFILSINVLYACTGKHTNTISININIEDNTELREYLENELNTITNCKIKGNIECLDDTSIDTIIKTSKNTSYIRMYTEKCDDIHKWVSKQSLIKTKIANLGLKSTIYVYFIDDSMNIDSIDINSYADKIVA